MQNHDANSTVYFKEISVIETAKTIDKQERDQIMSYFHSARKQTLDAIDGLSDAQWNFRPAPEKWTIAEVIEHLTLTEPGLFGFATYGLKNSVAGPSSMKDEELKARNEGSLQARASTRAVQAFGEMGFEGSARGRIQSSPRCQHQVALGDSRRSSRQIREIRPGAD